MVRMVRMVRSLADRTFQLWQELQVLLPPHAGHALERDPLPVEVPDLHDALARVQLDDLGPLGLARGPPVQFVPGEHEQLDPAYVFF